MKRSILSICILLASVSLVFANIYKKYDVRSGLSGNCVRSILQDSIGYMWFATQDGLNRFNGIEFTNYGHSSENGGNSYMNIVTICRHQDNNQIWVASTEKLYLFDSREEKFSVFDTQGRRIIFFTIFSFVISLLYCWLLTYYHLLMSIIFLIFIRYIKT